MRCHTARSIAVLVASLSFGSAIANAPSWQIETPGHGPANGPVWAGAVPLSDGGALLTRSSPPNALLVWRMHPDLGLGPPQRLPGVGVLYGEVLDHGRPTLLASASSPLPIQSPARTCGRRVEALPGFDLREFRGSLFEFGRQFEHGLPALEENGRPGYAWWTRTDHQGDALSTLFAHDADCSPQLLHDESGYVLDLVKLQSADAIVVLVERADATGFFPVQSLARFDAQGRSWQRDVEREDGVIVIATRLIRLADDSVVVGGSDGHGLYQGFAQRFGADGERLWEARIEWPETDQGPPMYFNGALAVGSTTVLSFRPDWGWITPPGGLPDLESLVVLDADGAELTRHTLFSSLSRVRRAPQHRHEPLYRSGNQILHLSEDGSLDVVRQGPVGSDVSLLAELADGRLLIQRREDEGPSVWDADSGEEHTFSMPQPTAPPNIRLHGDRWGIVERVRPADSLDWILRSLDPDGQIAWQVDLTGLAAVLGVESASTLQVDADASRVCIQTLAGETVLLPCFDRSSGALLYPPPGFARTSWPDARTLWLTEAGPWAVRRDPSSWRILVQPAGVGDSERRERIVMAAPGYSRFPDLLPLDARHLAIVGRAQFDFQDSVRVVDVEDRVVLNLGLGSDWGGDSTRLYALADGFLLTSAHSTIQDVPHLDLVRIGSEGSIRWRQRIERAPDPAEIGGFQPLRGRDGRWLYWERTRSGLRLLAFDDLDGSIAWERRVGLRSGTESGCVLPALDGPYGVLSRRDRRIEVAWLSPANGRLLDVSTIEDGGEIDCGTPRHETWLTTLPAPVGDTGTALSTEIDGRRRLLRIDPPQREALPGEPAALAGVWYDPAASGQGFILDWYADPGLLGGAWFSYSRDGGHARSEQRWYSLEAVPGEDGWLEGTLRASSGGAFAAPGSVPAEAVGSLRLRRVAADELVLDYAFDDGSPGGAILLRRLLPGAGADGSARQAGFWYDPASSGQGLYLLQDEGPVPFAAGAWFSFDPQGSADDPAAQHWFTLHGAAPETDGAVPLEILRHIGGSLDDEPTANRAPVGQARWRALGCDQGLLDYRFDESPWAEEFLGLQGQLSLRRLGGCAGD